jgi:small-conductance mechanosensitive channel/CRP-like cAMP-binding protein
VVTSPLASLGISLALLIVSAVVRAVTPNRLVRSKLRLTLLVATAAAVLAVGLSLGAPRPDLAERLGDVERLLLALGVINFAVTVAINPLGADRVPARFPAILQDAVVVGLFLVVATLVMQEKFLTTSAVGAVILGFALQDTLGNAFAGLAIQTEKPFHAGQWVRVGTHEGCVDEITWRATKLRTKSGSFVIVPNSLVSREAIINFSEPVVPTRTFVEVGASYLVPPNVVKDAIHEAIRNAPLALPDPAPVVGLADFGSSAILYRAQFWVSDFAHDEHARDQVRTNIYYTFKRQGIEIPWPIQVEYERPEPPERTEATTERFLHTLGRVDVFAGLEPDERRELAERSLERLYTANEAIVREGEPGASMFVVCSGRVRVTLAPDNREVASMAAGGFFGEMSLLTGAARTATVSAATECVLMEITVDAFRRFVLDKPSVLERVTSAVAARREELERTRAIEVAPARVQGEQSFLDLVRRFLGLTA